MYVSVFAYMCIKHFWKDAELNNGDLRGGELPDGKDGEVSVYSLLCLLDFEIVK